jgi:hypothetical protein
VTRRGGIVQGRLILTTVLQPEGAPRWDTARTRDAEGSDYASVVLRVGPRLALVAGWRGAGTWRWTIARARLVARFARLLRLRPDLPSFGDLVVLAAGGPRDLDGIDAGPPPAAESDPPLRVLQEVRVVNRAGELVALFQDPVIESIGQDAHGVMELSIRTPGLLGPDGEPWP